MQGDNAAQGKGESTGSRPNLAGSGLTTSPLERPEIWSPLPRQVARQIEEMIARGGLSNGGRLPSQRDLSNELGVSRASVREALLLLEAAGTIKTQPGRGTFVLSEQERVNKIDAGRRAIPPELTSAYYSKLDICQFRLVVEGQCARLAAMRINDDQIASLERNLATFKGQTRRADSAASAATDFEFHQLIVQFAGVKLFTDLHLNMRTLVMQAIRIPTSVYSRAWEPVIEHERILEAIRRRDPDETRYYMQSHILRSAERLGVLLADDLV
jgi:GntR family transcriptional repressor for pyruvate dehydrogenase complex